MALAAVVLKPGREKSVLHGHPWLFSGAAAEVPGYIKAGDTIRVLDSHKKFLAYAFCNPKSQLLLRILGHDEVRVPDETVFIERIRSAIERRSTLLDASNNSCRLIFSESDLLPGLIADKFGDYVVIQTLTMGAERYKKFFADTIMQNMACKGVVEKNDAEAREREGLPLISGLLAGAEMPEDYSIVENGLKFFVNVSEGQKTGYYLDQRNNRAAAAAYARERTVLDCFSYSGSFALHCLKAGAKSVLRIDSSVEALDAGVKNLKLNGIDPGLAPSEKANAFELLRVYRDSGKQFDMVVLDPPKLAPTKTQAEKAMRAYKDINLLAMKLLSPSGILVTFSCSSGVSAEEFRTVIAWAASDAGREAQIIGRLTQPEDHPVLLSFPESEYLKGLIVRVL